MGDNNILLAFVSSVILIFMIIILPVIMVGLIILGLSGIVIIIMSLTENYKRRKNGFKFQKIGLLAGVLMFVIPIILIPFLYQIFYNIVSLG